ncbi:Mannosylfructose-phosphate synthase [Rhodobacteraceae bacterium THAF1]|uniref:HAD-IIB family hydrolase n=1 Tax=Palleronia sp. THAF1 TaxID=2587842 RepID=UPI000F3EA367|nr:HAD-IIB family hydrolase [Palleronia sp. THAF1]QFU08732.1 Mannosylfructose-phosphate synthase [Palleronia sp. THAF1]VDC27014.1 Mannosylfructose-phosphate synthase [Rhodobacteraceae bacterium THAF1]
MSASVKPLNIWHLALGGCLSAPPVPYGLTEDTGGHIAFVLGAATAQANLSSVGHVTIVTRGFHDKRLGTRYGYPTEPVGPDCTIRRLFTDCVGYLEKGRLNDELPSLTDAFLKMLEEHPRPDVIHAHFADAAQLAQAAQERFGIPWVYTPHSLGIDKLADGASGAALQSRIEQERDAILGAGVIVTSSRDEAERQVAAYGFASHGRVHRVDPGVDVSRSADTNAARRLVAPFLRDLGKPIVLAIARPVEKKNLAGVIRGFVSDPTLRKRANLVILPGLRDGLSDGCPEQRRVMADLFDLVDRHDLWGSIAMPRQHSAAEVQSMYAWAAQGGVFVAPSFHEPFGLTIVEAAQAGVPIVATCRGGPSSIVAEISAGILVDPKDDACIGRAIGSMLDAPRHEIDQAKVKARAVYSWPRWAARVDTIYRDLLRPRKVQASVGMLLASDIDDTLTGDRAGARAFGKWLKAKHKFGFAAVTGRCLSEARRVIADWDLPVPQVWITSVGTEIWRPDAQGGLALCNEYASVISNGWDAGRIEDILADLRLTPQDGYEQRPWKRSYFGTERQAQRAELLLAQAGIAARVIPSHGRFIDVIPVRAGKANAVRFELERMGLPQHQCIVAGDSGNDADMLSQMPKAVVPANGRSEIAHIEQPGLYRASRSHAFGVIEGVEAHRTFEQLPMAAE